MTDWIQSIATIILGAATIALFWVTKTLGHSTDRLARIWKARQVARERGDERP